jgi:type III protein arginine methyltransferase
MTATASLETLLSRVAAKPVPLARLARLFLAKGQGVRARELCEVASAMAPADGEVRAISAEVFSWGVPRWHFPMMQDRERNIAYEAALRRVIRPGCRVLEIGTGSGLLAMMAARAGAAEVITCECNPAVAAAASEIIARNGFADRIRLVAKHSSDLEIGVDLNGPADVLVSELVTNNLISNGVLPAMEQAVRRLLRPGAKIIPARGAIRVALAEDREAHREEAGTVEGFDLSPFNQLAAPCYGISVGDERLALRSVPADLFCFDFQSGGPFPEGRATVPLVALTGCVNGIAQWFRLEMDEGGWYEDFPGAGRTSHWVVLFYPLRQVIKVDPGAELTVRGAHDRFSLRVWAELNQAL